MADALNARAPAPVSALAAAAAAFAMVAGPAPAADGRNAISDPTVPPPEYRPGTPEDPHPEAAAAAPSDPVRLQMIARNGELRLAVLNGRSVHAGDELTIDGKTVRVVAINDDSVVLKQDGRRQILHLNPHAGASPVCSGSAPKPGACRRSSPGASR